METPTDYFESILDSYWRGGSREERDALNKILELLSSEKTDLQSRFYDFLVGSGESVVKPLIEALVISQNEASLMVMEALGETPVDP